MSMKLWPIVEHDVYVVFGDVLDTITKNLGYDDPYEMCADGQANISDGPDSASLCFHTNFDGAIYSSEYNELSEKLCGYKIGLSEELQEYSDTIEADGDGLIIYLAPSKDRTRFSINESNKSKRFYTHPEELETEFDHKLESLGVPKEMRHIKERIGNIIGTECS